MQTKMSKSEADALVRSYLMPHAIRIINDVNDILKVHGWDVTFRIEAYHPALDERKQVHEEADGSD